MKVLIACEESQTYTKIFRELGHEAYSCDLQAPSGDLPQYHIQGDCLEVAYDKSHEWQLMIAHPPCTVLSSVGRAHLSHPQDKALPFWDRRPHPRNPNRREELFEALDFVGALAKAPIPYIAIENPVGWLNGQFGKDYLSLAWRADMFKKAYTYQPYQFGDKASKRTCYWFKGLDAPIAPIGMMDKRLTNEQKGLDEQGRNLWFEKSNAKQRSKTFPNMAYYFADQILAQIDP